MNQQLKKRCISIAKAMCPTNRDHRSAHVAFLIKKSKIQIIGWNKKRGHPCCQKHPYPENVTIHAELDVILKAHTEDYTRMTLAVVRIDRNGKIRNSKPCPGCQSVINQVGIKDLWYSSEEDNIEPKQNE